MWGGVVFFLGCWGGVLMFYLESFDVLFEFGVGGWGVGWVLGLRGCLVMWMWSLFV